MSEQQGPSDAARAQAAPGPVARFVARRSTRPDGPGSDGDFLDSASSSPRLLRRDLVELAELAELAADPAVTDLFANGPDRLWVDRGQGLVPVPPVLGTESQLRDLAVRLIASGGRHIDEAAPCVDVQLRDGVRVHAVLPPISTRGTLLSIRLPRPGWPSIHELAADGFFDGIAPPTIAELVAQRRNILITGASGSGKTTLLSALLATAAPTDRIVAIEDVAELRVDHPHFVALQSRQPNLEGAGAVDLARLVREALRMRPDRLVLGECRGAEIRELLSALNTGHDGGAGTLHANSLADVPARIEALGALANLGPSAIARQTVSAIQFVLHLERRAHTRRLVQLGRFELDSRSRLRIAPVDTGALHAAEPS